MSKTGEIYHLRLGNPKKVDRRGHDYGGALKLHHRTDDGSNAYPITDEIIIVKWPSYSQWSGVGHRESNKVEYWMLRVVTEPDESVYTECEFIKGIDPGRKRSLVKAFVKEADTLYHEESGSGPESEPQLDQWDRRVLTSALMLYASHKADDAKKIKRIMSVFGKLSLSPPDWLLLRMEE